MHPKLFGELLPIIGFLILYIYSFFFSFSEYDFLIVYKKYCLQLSNTKTKNIGESVWGHKLRKICKKREWVSQSNVSLTCDTQYRLLSSQEEVHF
jgi:hypothetical protein